MCPEWTNNSPEFRLSSNKILVYEPMPNSGGNNSLGYRGSLPEPNKLRKRIIFIGDSVTYGQDVSLGENFVARFSEQLKNKVEVINLAVPGYNFRQLAEVAKEKALKLEPDLLVFGVCMNDFLPNSGELERVSRFISRNSNKTNPQLYTDYYGGMGGVKRILLKSSLVRTLYYSPFFKANNGSEFTFKKMIDDQVGAEYFERGFELLKSLHDVEKVSMVFVLLPFRQGSEKKPKAIEFAFQGLSRKLNRLGLKTVDLHRHFYRNFEHSKIQRLFQSGNDFFHYTSGGHRIVSEELGKLLRAEYPSLVSR